MPKYEVTSERDAKQRIVCEVEAETEEEAREQVEELQPEDFTIISDECEGFNFEVVHVRKV